MSKKLLIIQLDGAYFLHETLRVLEKSWSILKDFNLTLLVSPEHYQNISDDWSPMIKGITIDKDLVLKNSYDLSINLSLAEESWDYHGQVRSASKSGCYRQNGEFYVPDSWSTYFLTVKSQAPFLTFHLQDIYRNILGIKNLAEISPSFVSTRQIVLGRFNPSFCYESEWNELVSELKNRFPLLTFSAISEIDLLSDFTHTTYIGPACLDAIKICEAGARGIFIGSRFQGFNLLPYQGPHFFISTRGEGIRSDRIVGLLESLIKNSRPVPSAYSLYEYDQDSFGPYLAAVNNSDTNYPFYQTHVVLWNFLLNLLDVSLDVAKCTQEQLDALRENHHALSKLLRLHDYAMNSVDFIYQEAKSASSRGQKVEEHLKNLREMEELQLKVAQSHPYLRSFLDFYHIRKSQNDGGTLLEQAQHSFLVYSEEHQALSALLELFSVTLRKNEASISK